MKELLVQFSDTNASQTSLGVKEDHLTHFNRDFQLSPDFNFPETIVKTDSVLVESVFTGESVAKFFDVAYLTCLQCYRCSEAAIAALSFFQEDF